MIMEIGNNKSTKFGFRMAKEGANHSTCKVKMGASLISKKNVVIIAWNSDKGSPKASKLYKYPNEGTHAEFNLFNNFTLDNKITGTVYIYRSLANGTTGLAAPCESCRLFLKTRGIRRIFYSDYSNTFKEEKLE